MHNYECIIFKQDVITALDKFLQRKFVQYIGGWLVRAAYLSNDEGCCSLGLFTFNFAIQIEYRVGNLSLYRFRQGIRA